MDKNKSFEFCGESLKLWYVQNSNQSQKDVK